MTLQNKKPRSLLEAAFIKYGIEVMTVARLTGTNKMRINRLQRGIAPARRDLRERILKVVRHLANDDSITEADLFPPVG